MKKILLPEASNNLKYYRANLHCHSTISDGAKSPEQLKADYMAHGYSIIAFTDHEVFIPHNDLSDKNFLALNGFEFSASQKHPVPNEDTRTCHLCLIAYDRNQTKQPCWHRSNYVWGNAHEFMNKVNFDESLPDFIREYSPECVNEVIKSGVENDFFVTYNHPFWSLEQYEQYSKYCGMDAMEIVNFGCVVVGYDDENAHAYEDLLRQNKRLYCIATDDNHNRYPDSDPNCDSYGGYTMIAAPSLDYEAVTDALRNGQFYSATGNYKQTGPEIKSIVYEDGFVTIKTSPARSICYLPNRRACKSAQAPDGEYVTEAKFAVNENTTWFRFTVTDYQGFKAYSNAYFTDDLK